MITKEIIGKVISNKMDKTITVVVTKKLSHRKYNKILSKTKKYYVHDENNNYVVGDIVKIKATRPISKKKYWTVIDKLK
uniref:Small ribosomal subunit protein uS17c n=1 Tax=Corallina ferreyrae TaxID=2547422 RepID=A0A482CGI0_9FLOR|nr:30S ribosomal protein S17 [Corallina ferreyrae]QBL75652.1 30S ribosomal protein S17 [Corallina ferreyrae]